MRLVAFDISWDSLSTMVVGGSLQVSREWGVYINFGCAKKFKVAGMQNRGLKLKVFLSSCSSQQDIWNLRVSNRIYKSLCHVHSPTNNVFICRAFVVPNFRKWNSTFEKHHCGTEKILVSCFVKTSHFEEYLCVMEAILLDLLRVISHHRARLATPIRTVQKIYGDPDVESIPFEGSIFTRSGLVTPRPLLLMESVPRVNSDDKAKACPTPKPNLDEQKTKQSSSSTSEVTVLENIEKQQQKVNTGEVSPKSGEGDVSTTVSGPSAKLNQGSGSSSVTC